MLPNSRIMESAGWVPLRIGNVRRRIAGRFRYLFHCDRIGSCLEQSNKGSDMNETLHAVILALFGGACWFLSMMLKLPVMVVAPQGTSLPAFTRLCMGVGSGFRFP
jgi:hypothetical protein